MDTISSKTRNMVRRCISECVVQIVDYQQIARGGGLKCIYLNVGDSIEKDLEEM